MTNHSLASFDAAPYGVYRWVGEQPPGVPQAHKARAAMGRGQWITRSASLMTRIMAGSPGGQAADR